MALYSRGGELRYAAFFVYALSRGNPTTCELPPPWLACTSLALCLLERHQGDARTPLWPEPKDADSLIGVEQVVRGHWREFGRSFYQRHDYEDVDKERAVRLQHPAWLAALACAYCTHMCSGERANNAQHSCRISMCAVEADGALAARVGGHYDLHRQGRRPVPWPRRRGLA